MRFVSRSSPSLRQRVARCISSSRGTLFRTEDFDHYPRMRAAVFLAFLLSSATQAHEVTIIPIRSDGAGHIATVQINDVPLTAIIDTSGYHTIGISPAALRKLNVRYGAGAVERIDGEGHRFPGREFRV